MVALAGAIAWFSVLQSVAFILVCPDRADARLGGPHLRGRTDAWRSSTSHRDMYERTCALLRRSCQQRGAAGLMAAEWWSFQDDAEEPETKELRRLSVDRGSPGSGRCRVQVYYHVRRVGHGYDSAEWPTWSPCSCRFPATTAGESGRPLAGLVEAAAATLEVLLARDAKGTATCGDAYAGKWDIPDGCPGDYQLAWKPDAEGFGKYRRLWYFIGAGPELPM